MEETTTSTILANTHGTVVDTDGNGIDDAVITFENSENKQKMEVIDGTADGYFTGLLLKDGLYTVTVEAPSFESITKTIWFRGLWTNEEKEIVAVEEDRMVYEDPLDFVMEKTPSPNDPDERIESIWDGIVDLVKDFISVPSPFGTLGTEQPQLDPKERKKTIDALESFDFDSSEIFKQNKNGEIKTQSANEPAGFPIELCFDLVYTKICNASGYPQTGRPRCHVSVPKVRYFSFSVNQYSRDLSERFKIDDDPLLDRFSLDFSTENLWIGVDEDGCVWAGEETSGSCAKMACRDKVDYMNDPVPEVVESAFNLAYEAANDVLDELNEKFSNWRLYVVIAFIAIAIAILVIKAVPLSFLGGVLLVSGGGGAVAS